MTIAADSLIRDASLAPEGRLKIEFAGRRMPVLQAIRQEFRATRPLAGVRIAACLHVTTETANLCQTLIDAGAELSLCASNPLSTKDDVAASIYVDGGARVFAQYNCDRETFYKQIDGALSGSPNVIIDDGADLTVTVHQRPEMLDAIIGGTEVTSTGVLRMRNMARDGALRYPVFPVNDAETKHLFDNRYGTGQNTIDGILRATNVLLAGSVFVVVGYGWCGRGVAMRARGMGARVIVVEVDSIKALEAHMEGFQVMPMSQAAAQGDIFVTVTGSRNAISLEHVDLMKSDAIICNSGHFDVEIDVEGIRQKALTSRTMRPNMVEHHMPGGKRVIVLAEGRLVGQSAAEAHPAEVMDMTFSTKALAIEYLVKNGKSLAPGVQDIPREIELRVAQLKLEALGIAIEQLSNSQRDYLGAWQVGT